MLVGADDPVRPQKNLVFTPKGIAYRANIVP